jgi:hypothetical protein
MWPWRDFLSRTSPGFPHSHSLGGGSSLHPPPRCLLVSPLREGASSYRLLSLSHGAGSAPLSLET